MAEIDTSKTDRLFDTIMDFLYHSDLTNMELDFIINRIWFAVQAKRVAAAVLSTLPPPMMVLPFTDDTQLIKPDQSTGGPGIH